jgi:hypothetical protein
VKARALAIVFDGLAPHPNAPVQTRHQPEPSPPHRRPSP